MQGRGRSGTSALGSRGSRRVGHSDAQKHPVFAAALVATGQAAAAACCHLCILAQQNGMEYASVALRIYLGIDRLNQDVRPINIRRMEPPPLLN